MRAKCVELQMEESYSTKEGGQWFVWFHLDRKVRLAAIERAFALVSAVQNITIAGFAVDHEIYVVLGRHLAADDGSVVVWAKPGRQQSLASKRPRDVRSLEHQQELDAKDAELQRALAAKDGEVRTLLLQREDAEDSRLDEREAELLELRTRLFESEHQLGIRDAELAQSETMVNALRGVGPVAHKETLLRVDLHAERQRVKLLQTQLVKDAEKAADAFAGEVAISRGLAIKINTLQTDMFCMQREAQEWWRCREGLSNALALRHGQLANAVAEIQTLGAQCACNEARIKELLQRDESAITAGLQAAHGREIASLEARAKISKKSFDFKEREWKRRTEALRDQVSNRFTPEWRADAYSAAKALLNAVLGVVVGDPSAELAVCHRLRYLVLNVLGGTEEEVDALNESFTAAMHRIEQTGTMAQVMPFAERLFNAMDLGHVMDTRVRCFDIFGI